MKINILNIRRKIPEPIKKPLRWFYHKWSVKLDDEVINNLMEYFNFDKKRAMYFLKNGGRLNADFWCCLNPKTDEEIKRFYQETPFYVFNLMFWHATSHQRALRSKIIKLAKGKILDFGGGAGDLAVELFRRGFSNVDYADLPGRTFEFAKWLFKKRKCKISMIDLGKEKISKKYDTIFCMDVIEHVTNPRALLKDFVKCLNDGGYLVINGLHPIIDKRAPMHFSLNFKPEEYLKSLGMIETDKPLLWIKKSKGF